MRIRSLSRILRESPVPPTCSCAQCVDMCRRWPCWGPPVEIRKLIHAGLGSRPMIAKLFLGPEILCPAFAGQEGRVVEWGWNPGRCTFLVDGTCELHDRGLKPVEERMAHHEIKVPEDLHEALARSWGTKAGRLVVARWKATCLRKE